MYTQGRIYPDFDVAFLLKNKYNKKGYICVVLLSE